MVRKTVILALLTVFILSGLSTAALAADEVEWVEKVDGKKLYWGDSVTVEGYVIKAEDFHEDGVVFITISKDGEELDSAPLSAGMEVEYDDEIKVHAQTVNPNYETIKKDGVEFRTGNWDPYAQVDVLLRGKPSFDIDVETEENSYDSKSTSDGRIKVTINVKNDGDAKAEDVVLTIDTAGLEVLSGKTKYTYTKVLKDESLEPITLTLKTPAPWEDTEYKIAGRTTFLDFKEEKYEDEGSKTIKVEKKWELVVSKTTPEERHMGEPVYVSVTVRNAGLCNINDIKLTDSTVSGMRLKEETELSTTISSLEPGEIAANVFKYTLIPEKPGTFTFPKTTATFTLPNGESKEVSSDNSDKTNIYGPYVVLTKVLSKQQLDKGDELTVTVTAKNTGNVDTSVTVTDTVPPEAKFISGETDFKGILKTGGSKTIKYVLQMHSEGEVQLPPCKVTFLDLEDYSGEVYSSNPPVVNVGTLTLEGSSAQTAGSTESNQEKNEESDTHVKTGGTEEDYGDTPGFGSFIAALGLLGVAGLRKKGLV